MEFWKLNLRIGILEIKFVSGNFENWNLGELESWKIIWKWKFWKLDLRIGVSKNYLKIKFKNWKFEKLFENRSFEN